MSDGLELLKPFLPGLEDVLEDPDVSEIMINGPHNVWIEGHGKLYSHDAPLLTAAALQRAAIHIARPLGLDPATAPIVDARLDDGSRVAICVPPASPKVAITVRRFGKRSFSAADLVEQGALPKNVKEAAEKMLHTRRNILVSGGTGSGKTTLLNALIELLPDDERIVAIEDTLELRIEHSNCVRFEARGLSTGAVTIRDLVRHALRHRPDHIVVGEVRGGEAADLLQALNTGHGGSLTTVHANNAESALSRLASCAMQGGGELPWEVTCRGVVDGIAMVIHMTRSDGRRFRRGSGVCQRLRGKGEQMENPTTQKDSSTLMNPHGGPVCLSCSLAWACFFGAVPAHSENAVVVRVIDGDTITVQIAGAIRTIRLIGVDTPETKHPTKAVQRGGPEASAFTQAMLDRKTVRLEADRAGDDMDRYDRLLRYVYLSGDDFFAVLIGLGYGRAIRTFPYSKRLEFIALEADARKRQVGLWRR